MKKGFIFAVLVLLGYSGAFAQYFQKEQISIGPNIGVLEHASFYGLSGEYGLTKNIGIGLDLGYYQFKEDFSTVVPGPIYGGYNPPQPLIKFNYQAYNFYLTGSYHFLPENRFDPFVRIGLGYINYGFDISIEGGDEDDPMYSRLSSGFPSVFSTKIEAGMNYHINDVLSFNTTLGYPYYFNSGFNINFNRPEPAANEADLKAAKDSYAWYFGYYLGTNISSTISVPEGTKFKPAVNFPDAGFSLYLPFEKESSLGFMLNAGYSETSYSLYPNLGSNDSNTVKERYGFITVQPMFNLGGFLLGMKIGIPKSAEAKNGLDQNVAIIADNYNKDTKSITQFSTTRKDIINTQFDIVLGGSFTLANFESGKLKLNLMASYALQPLYKKSEEYLPAFDVKKETVIDVYHQPVEVNKYTPNDKNNPTPVSVSLGLSYLFRLGF